MRLINQAGKQRGEASGWFQWNRLREPGQGLADRGSFAIAWLS